MQYTMSQNGLGSRIVPKGVSLRADCMGFVRIIGEISVYRAIGAGTAQLLGNLPFEGRKTTLGNHREPLREPVPEWFPHRSR